jgi:hypothetical protein
MTRGTIAAFSERVVGVAAPAIGGKRMKVPRRRNPARPFVLVPLFSQSQPNVNVAATSNGGAGALPHRWRSNQGAESSKNASRAASCIFPAFFEATAKTTMRERARLFVFS